MKRKGIRILLALVMVLSVTLVTFTPATADDGNDRNGAHFVNVGGKWEADVPGLGSIGGSIQVHGKVPDKGFVQGSHEFGILAGTWYRMEIIAVKIGELDGKPAAWYWGQCVAGDYIVNGVRIEDFTGYKVEVMVDGGTPGRDVDYGYASFRLSASLAETIYENEDISTLLYIDIARGNIIIK